MIADNIFHLLKPEKGHFVENSAFARNRIGHDDIKSRYPVRSHQQQIIFHGIKVAYFAAFEKFQFWKMGLSNCFVHRSLFPLSNGWVV
jgi:hypothetical protein